VAFPPPELDTDHPHARRGTLTAYHRCILSTDHAHVHQQVRGSDSLATGLFLNQHRKTERDIVLWRKKELLPGETARKRLKQPRLKVVL
jgi:hypothetical protein